jgi:hypothetical protein
VRDRQQVLHDRGFEAKLARGMSLSALFSGPSVTGKTPSAVIVAGERGLDRYRINLSQIVNKYIGETAQNRDRVFNATERANAIPPFDQSDALFGKRSDVNDAHDRYSNLEAGQLQQKLEDYEGLAIHSTNVRQNLDDAFLRRLSVIADFPFPDESQRPGIWRVLFAARAALAPRSASMRPPVTCAGPTATCSTSLPEPHSWPSRTARTSASITWYAPPSPSSGSSAGTGWFLDEAARTPQSL